MAKTRWGILATGRIAGTMAKAIAESKTGELVACGSRSQSSADRFAAEYGGIRAHSSYQSLIDDADVDAIYIATPHPQHVEWTVKSLQAKKAVLCEKPMGLNTADVMLMMNAAMQNDTFLMEAFMFRMHPQTQKIRELLEADTIGEIRHIHATFGFNAP